MNVLVTNDDGYGAWGIEALIKALSERHNVFVIAPDGNRSGNSHHISLGNKLILKKKYFFSLLFYTKFLRFTKKTVLFFESIRSPYLRYF